MKPFKIYVSDFRAGRFGWDSIAKSCRVLYIVRVINGKLVKFVPVQMAETEFFKKKMKCFTKECFTCTLVNSHFITENESVQLNYINIRHANYLYGMKPFRAN